MVENRSQIGSGDRTAAPRLDDHGQSCQLQACDKRWPPRPDEVPELLTPVEAAQYLRLDETDSHTPESAVRTLNYWRSKGQLKATKFARRVWYRRAELDRFLTVKTEP